MKTFIQWVEAINPQDAKIMLQAAQQGSQQLDKTITAKLNDPRLAGEPEDLMRLAKAKDKARGVMTPEEKNPNTLMGKVGMKKK